MGADLDLPESEHGQLAPKEELPNIGAPEIVEQNDGIKTHYLFDNEGNFIGIR